MTLGLAFWILMLIWLVFSLAQWQGYAPAGPYGHSILLFILFGLLGWAVFGAPLHG